MCCQCTLWRQASSVFLAAFVQWQQAATRTVQSVRLFTVYHTQAAAARIAESTEQVRMTQEIILGFLCWTTWKRFVGRGDEVPCILDFNVSFTQTMQSTATCRPETRLPTPRRLREICRCDVRHILLIVFENECPVLCYKWKMVLLCGPEGNWKGIRKMWVHPAICDRRNKGLHCPWRSEAKRGGSLLIVSECMWNLLRSCTRLLDRL